MCFLSNVVERAFSIWFVFIDTVRSMNVPILAFRLRLRFSLFNVIADHTELIRHEDTASPSTQWLCSAIRYYVVLDDSFLAIAIDVGCVGYVGFMAC